MVKWNTPLKSFNVSVFILFICTPNTKLLLQIYSNTCPFITTIQVQHFLEKQKMYHLNLATGFKSWSPFILRPWLGLRVFLHIIFCTNNSKLSIWRMTGVEEKKRQPEIMRLWRPTWNCVLVFCQWKLQQFPDLCRGLYNKKTRDLPEQCTLIYSSVRSISPDNS